MLVYCGECREVIKGEGVMWELCEDLFHQSCCYGMCLRCSSSVFHFNGTVSDDEFVTYLREHFQPPPTPIQLDCLVFNPLELNNIDAETFLDDVDPDKHFFSHIQLSINK